MKRLPLLLAAAFALGLGACQAPKRKPAPAHKAVTQDDRKAAEDLYIKGVYAYAEGKTDAAIADWKACLRRNPRHDKARRALAEAKAKQEAVKKLQ